MDDVTSIVVAVTDSPRTQGRHVAEATCSAAGSSGIGVEIRGCWFFDGGKKQKVGGFGDYVRILGSISDKLSWLEREEEAADGGTKALDSVTWSANAGSWYGLAGCA
jgi:hypothetical protein